MFVHGSPGRRYPTGEGNLPLSFYKKCWERKYRKVSHISFKVQRNNQQNLLAFLWKHQPGKQPSEWMVQAIKIRICTLFHNSYQQIYFPFLQPTHFKTFGAMPWFGTLPSECFTYQNLNFSRCTLCSPDTSTSISSRYIKY